MPVSIVISELFTFEVELLMYATPVIYPLSAIPGKYRFFILANPMTPIIETFRYGYGFLGSGTFDPLHLAYSTAFTAIILLIGILLFSRIERTFMDTV